MNSAHFAAITAFSLWGLFPLYWKLMSEVAAWDLFGHRLLWSFITLMLILAFRKKLPLVKEIWLDSKKRLYLILSAGLISSNWLLYIYAVNNGHVLEASMGYFLNPLFNILMGSLILKERIRRGQWPPILLALIAVILIGVQADIQHIPWIALILSVTFALYGLIRKTVHVGSVEGLAFETSVVIVPVLVAWCFRPTTPLSVIDILPWWKLVLLSFAGFITSIPLLLFTYGAKRLSFSTLGFIQYLSPSLKFICGLLIFHEPLSPERLQAFYLIWVALVWYSLESLFMTKKNRAKIK
jgi:chloramphenicol-sensitive protein RarD